MGNLFTYNNTEGESESYCGNSLKSCSQYINNMIPCDVLNKITTQPMAIPLQTTAVPLQTTAVPLQTTAVPLQMTAVPLQMTAVPLQTTDVSLQMTEVISSNTTPDTLTPKPIEVVSKSRFF